MRFVLVLILHMSGADPLSVQIPTTTETACEKAKDKLLADIQKAGITGPAVGLALASAVFGSAAAHADVLVGRARVIDGDTIEIAGRVVRLAGIDAPEGRAGCLAEVVAAGRAPPPPAPRQAFVHTLACGTPAFAGRTT